VFLIPAPKRRRLVDGVKGSAKLLAVGTGLTAAGLSAPVLIPTLTILRLSQDLDWAR
jgi:hypothetical protein